MKWLTVARDLKRRKARERTGLFVAEGVRTVEELVRSDLTVEAALVTEGAAAAERASAVIAGLTAGGVPVATLTDDEFATASGTENPQGLLAIARKPRRDLAALAPEKSMRLLVLDGIQDPGNVGVLLRTAAALGATAAVALPGTADLWNAKVVRSAAGSHFRFPAIEADVQELVEYLALHGIALWGTDTGGSPIGGITTPPRVAVAVGNEGAGLSGALRERCSAVVSLPMAPGVESLNVAVAAGITLYALRH